MHTDSELLDFLAKACGYVANATETTVRIFQDDATRDWLVKVGEGPRAPRGYGNSLRQAIENLMTDPDAIAPENR